MLLAATFSISLLAQATTQPSCDLPSTAPGSSTQQSITSVLKASYAQMNSVELMVASEKEIVGDVEGGKTWILGGHAIDEFKGRLRLIFESRDDQKIESTFRTVLRDASNIRRDEPIDTADKRVEVLRHICDDLGWEKVKDSLFKIAEDSESPARIRDLAILTIHREYKSEIDPKDPYLKRAQKLRDWLEFRMTQEIVDQSTKAPFQDFVNDKRDGLGAQDQLLFGSIIKVNGEKITKQQIEKLILSLGAEPSPQESELQPATRPTTNASNQSVFKLQASAGDLEMGAPISDDPTDKNKIGGWKSFSFSKENKIDPNLAGIEITIVYNQATKPVQIRTGRLSRDKRMQMALVKTLRAAELGSAFAENDNLNSELEKKVSSRISNAKPTIPLIQIKRSQLDEFFKSKNGVLVIPDFHDLPIPYRMAEAIGAGNGVDWVALEMPKDCQGECDKFMKCDLGICESDFPQIWANEARLYTGRNNLVLNDDTSNMNFSRLLSNFRNAKKSVVAMDADKSYVGSWEILDGLTLSTRNAAWASQIPETGRGLVFGGYAHFANPQNLNVQDFLREKFTDRPIYILSFANADEK